MLTLIDAVELMVLTSWGSIAVGRPGRNEDAFNEKITLPLLIVGTVVLDEMNESVVGLGGASVVAPLSSPELDELD
jgi:hypothetical protein